MGKAKFGIFGDGKGGEIAMAKAFRNGDFRSGHYQQSQTFMLAIGEFTLQQYFAQLYAHTEIEADPATAGRLMNGHFATRSLDEKGNWKDLSRIKNSSSDISPTAGTDAQASGLGLCFQIIQDQSCITAFDTIFQ